MIWGLLIIWAIGFFPFYFAVSWGAVDETEAGMCIIAAALWPITLVVGSYLLLKDSLYFGERSGHEVPKMYGKDDRNQEDNHGRV